ncbi:hypothetical protein PACTADRAFT_47940 [Pachysolen tannophilus NRRL Y-2460]|uniref:Ribosomal protein S8 n=1 Tax=Pachysolen tannophilus NRRL Y-2460 TaxID=669874 RepID=A0A1E4U294_PACTA|nr:hypothetical protein PACTADRAFT_47940 [Pachysolen tannophilus NRRL Y-2460]
MSLVHLANVCAHLQNCSRVNLPLAHIPLTRLHLQVALGLYKHGFIKSIQKGSTLGPDLVPTEVTPDNISSRRLWLGLKYKNSKPVLNKISLVSKPNRRLFLDKEEIRALSGGSSVRVIKPLQPGEIIFIRTLNKDLVDLQDAAERHLGGEVVCRAR